MPTLYFRKEIVSNPFYVRGKPVGFEFLPGNRGILAIDDSPTNHGTIAALNEAASRQRLGIVKINQEDYEDLKKNASLTRSANNSRPREFLQRVNPTPSPFPTKSAEPAKAATTTAPAPEPPKPLGTPPVPEQPPADGGLPPPFKPATKRVPAT